MSKIKLLPQYSGLFVLIILTSFFLPWQIFNFAGVKDVKAAAVNLIKDPSFDQNISQNWYLWESDTTTRSYSLVRSYDSPFGYGPYSMAVEVTSGSDNRNAAGIVSINPNQFDVIAGKTYTLSFFAKASSQTEISTYIERVDNYQAITAVKDISIDTTWQKKQVSFTPSESGLSSLTFLVGSLPGDATLYLDGFSLFENNISLSTTIVSGYIGDENKALNLVNGNLLVTSDISIELPYYDEQTGIVGVKLFAPKTSLKNNYIYFDMPAQTFSGIGKVYAYGTLIGQFDYNVLVKISDYNPNPALADEDLAIYGTGFMPDNNQNFVIVTVIDTQGKTSERWIKPHIIDDRLSQVVVKLPIGITNSQLSAVSYHTNQAGVSVENKSRSLRYVVKPSIYNLDWSQKGYEQIGDKITILGKGMSTRPRVHFYDENDNFISSAMAKVKSINEGENYEEIEVVTPKQLNKLKVTVKVGSVESDKADALSYSAKPILQSIQAVKYRTIQNTKTRVAAARAGDTIKLIGQGYKNASSINVNFPGLNGIIQVPVSLDKVNPNGTSIEVIVPKQAQNGQISVQSENQTSNLLPLEIIPTVVSTLPLQPWPGEELSIWANGLGLNTNLATVHFKLTNNETVAVTPISLEPSPYGDVIVKVIAPKAITNDSSTIKLQYENWLSDQSYDLKAAPHIERAVVDLENKLLIIKGYGFSNSLKENKITYKYADGTIVTPEVRMLSIKTTEEGQEIRIQILDSYSYGYVSVTVNNETSNEFSVGKVIINKIDRRVQFVATENRVMGVLYISGKNFGTGDVKVGDVWAATHYRTNTFIIAVVETGDVNKNPVIITKN